MDGTHCLNRIRRGIAWRQCWFCVSLLFLKLEFHHVNIIYMLAREHMLPSRPVNSAERVKYRLGVFGFR